MNTTLTSSTIRNRPGSGRTRNSMTAQSRVRKVPKTLRRAVVRSSGRNANSTALTAGIIRIALTTSAPGSVIVAARRRSWPLAAEAIERVHVDRIEALENAGQEDPDHDQRGENGKGDADLDQQQHGLSAGRGEDQPIPDRHAILIEQHETYQHQAAGEQMRDIEGEPVHQPPRETKRSRAARRPSMSAAPRNSETRKTRILAMTVSNTASTNPPTASLSTYTG